MKNFFTQLSNALLGGRKTATRRSEIKVEPFFVAGQQKETVQAHKAMAINEKEDFNLLLGIYKKYKETHEINFGELVQSVNPTATPHVCPYCGTSHEFTATRARKCPACSKKMVVRQGLFITERQAEQLEKLVQDSYSTQASLSRVGSELEFAQSSKIQKRNVDQLRAMAEAFRYAAQVENHRDAGGYSFWDKAWGYYSRARLVAMKEIKDKDMLPYSNLPEIMWDMAQMLLDQAESETGSERIEKDKKQALAQACMSLAEAAKLGTTPYYSPQLYAFAKKIIIELRVTEETFKSVSDAAATGMRLTDNSLTQYSVWIQELSEYEIINR